MSAQSARAAPADLSVLEAQLLERGPLAATAPAIFILGSPRTGSTFLYQLMVNAFKLPFIDNLTNDFFPETPIVGLVLGAALRKDEPVSLVSRFGKVSGLLQPSEGSRVMIHWFGGGHPSQLVSKRILPGREEHLRATLLGCDAMLGGPLMIKNAWNCFRAAWIADTFPSAAFVWIRRDIREAAKSDLLARYLVQGDATKWNSATPANFEVLAMRPPAEQVVENQFEFGEAVAATRDSVASGRFVEVWYEDLLADPYRELTRIATSLSLLCGRALKAWGERTGTKEPAEALGAGEAQAIDAYVARQIKRFREYVRI